MSVEYQYAEDYLRTGGRTKGGDLSDAGGLSGDAFQDIPRGSSRGATGAEKGLKALFVVIALILVVELIWLFGVKAALPLSTVKISGIPELDRSFVLLQGGIDSRSSFITVNAQAVEEALAELTQVASARVIKRYPDGLEIVLAPSKPAALSLVSIDGRLRPVYFDKQGVIIRIGKDIREKDRAADIPIVSGIIFEEPRLGARLPAMFEPFFSRLEELNEAVPELLAAISEIRVQRKAYDGFDLLLFPVHNQVRFRLESELNEDTLRYMLLMIDVFVSQGLTVEEVDLRTGTASYVVKEASSG
jgi:cell division protein FtsQ